MICEPAAKNFGTAMLPLNCMVAPPSVVGRGMDAAVATEVARLEPKMAAMLPGATAPPGAKLAAFTEPLALMNGSPLAATLSTTEVGPWPTCQTLGEMRGRLTLPKAPVREP